MSSFKQPYFDRSIAYDANRRFSNDIMQKYMALFISKPELYPDICKLPEHHREDYFFSKFFWFTQKYVNMNIEKNYDSHCYFGSLYIGTAGSSNLSGNKDAAKQFKQGNDALKERIKYLSDKYRITPDMREFIGHTKIWMNPSPELLKLGGWEWVSAREYTDETFTAEMPEHLDSDLIPLAIRNKTLQKWKTKKNRHAELKAISSNRASTQEEDEEVPKTVTPQGANAAFQVVITPEMQALIDAEEW